MHIKDNKIKIPIKIINEDAEIPEYQHIGEDAGMDLVTVETKELMPGEYKLFKTGVAIALPQTYMAKIAPRSGLALKHGITVLNSEGTIDPGYRGEIGVILINHGEEPYKVVKGSRIAQMVIERFCQVEWEVVGNLEESTRGQGGFGHTGK